MEKCVLPSPMWPEENLSSADAPCIRWNYFTDSSGGLNIAKEILVSGGEIYLRIAARKETCSPCFLSS